MGMSRRHYEHLAAIVGRTLYDDEQLRRTLVFQLANWLGDDNPLFDRNRFAQAVQHAADNYVPAS